MGEGGAEAAKRVQDVWSEFHSQEFERDRLTQVERQLHNVAQLATQRNTIYLTGPGPDSPTSRIRKRHHHTRGTGENETN